MINLQFFSKPPWFCFELDIYLFRYNDTCNLNEFIYLITYKRNYFENSSKLIDWYFSIFEFFHRGGITKHNILIVHKKISYLDLLSFLIYPHFSYFRFIVIICTMVKEIGRFLKYNLSKLSNPTLKKPVLSSSADHK